MSLANKNQENTKEYCVKAKDRITVFVEGFRERKLPQELSLLLNHSLLFHLALMHVCNFTELLVEVSLSGN